jgi:hypothetical protein
MWRAELASPKTCVCSEDEGNWDSVYCHVAIGPKSNQRSATELPDYETWAPIASV